jgi:hypothetical protein
MIELNHIITNGYIDQATINGYLEKGYIFLCTVPGKIVHPHAMDTDKLTIFSKYIESGENSEYTLLVDNYSREFSTKQLSSVNDIIIGKTYAIIYRPDNWPKSEQKIGKVIAINDKLILIRTQSIIEKAILSGGYTEIANKDDELCNIDINKIERIYPKVK